MPEYPKWLYEWNKLYNFNLHFKDGIKTVSPNGF